MFSYSEYSHHHLHNHRVQNQSVAPTPYHNTDIALKFMNKLCCHRDPTHGSYDFICNSPTPCRERLVCSDCLTRDHTHMTEHGTYFKRFNKFIEQNFTEFQESPKVIELKRFLGQQTQILHNFDEDCIREEETIKSLFRKEERRILDIIKRYLKEKYKKLIGEFRVVQEQSNIDIKKNLKDCRMVVDLAENGILKSLDALFSDQNPSSVDKNELNKKLDRIILASENFETVLFEKWSMFKKGSIKKATFSYLSHQTNQLNQYFGQLETSIESIFQSWNYTNMSYGESSKGGRRGQTISKITRHNTKISDLNHSMSPVSPKRRNDSNDFKIDISRKESDFPNYSKNNGPSFVGLIPKIEIQDIKGSEDMSPNQLIPGRDNVSSKFILLSNANRENVEIQLLSAAGRAT